MLPVRNGGADSGGVIQERLHIPRAHRSIAVKVVFHRWFSFQAVQSKLPNLACAIFIAVEGAILAAGQGIGGDRDLPHHLNLSRESVYSHEAAVCHAVDLPICRIIGHVGQHRAQIGNPRQIGQLVLGHDIQVALICGGQYIMVHNGSRIERQVRGGIAGEVGAE